MRLAFIVLTAILAASCGVPSDLAPSPVILGTAPDPTFALPPGGTGVLWCVTVPCDPGTLAGSR